MSTTTALRQYSVLRAESTTLAQKPRLSVIEGTTPSKGRIALLLIALVAIVVSIAIPMVIQAHMAQRAFEIRTYHLELNELNAHSWTAQTKLRSLESAISLENKARALGMVPAQVSGTISLERHTVEGGVVSR